jgi:putative transposase
VRRAFLCGKDSSTGYDFEHRRVWIEARLHKLAKIFAIDVCAYAVMSNHYHLVLHINTDNQHLWSSAEVVARWARLHRLPEGFDAVLQPEKVAAWRERLGSISWFMKCINEPLARWANKEDQCKGRFWEGRFRSQALLDEAAVIRCMAYVDLNPVRARVAASPEESAHTSIQARLQKRDYALAPMATARRSGFSLPIAKAEYVALVDWTARQIRTGSRGRIEPGMPPVIARMASYCRRPWIEEMCHLSRWYFRAIGSTSSMLRYRDFLGQVRLKGVTA